MAFAALVLATLAMDVALHLLGAVWVGRHLGIPGTLLILGSFGYSLRKRKLISMGKPVVLLRLHERMAWGGSLLVLVHAGIHFNALLGWLAAAAMLINVGSGLTGKYLLERSRRRLVATRQRLREQGLSRVLNFDNCVSCHRSAEGEGGEHGEGREQGRGRKDDD